MLGTRGAMHACSVLSDSSILPDSSVHGIFQERTLNQVLPCPSPGDLPDPRIKPMSPASPALADGFFTTMPLGSRDFEIFFNEPIFKNLVSLLL